MKITYNDFVAACPAAQAPDTEVFDSIIPMIDGRLSFIRGLMTEDIFNQLDNIEDDLQNPEYERLCSISRNAKTYVCSAAYYNACPQLDLVLTPTGFGVVSNQNVAPASAERVAKLRKQLLIQQNICLDTVIDELRHIVDWSKSSVGPYFFNTLFWRCSHIRALGMENPTREDLVAKWPEIHGASLDFQKKLSPELYKALLKAESTDTATSAQASLITMWRNGVVARLSGSDSWVKHVMVMLRFVEDLIEEFPEYRESQTYKANHFERYENHEDDSCFFFG